MRTSEERIQELHHRMDTLAEMKERRNDRIRNAAIVLAALVITVAMALMIANAPVLDPGEIGESAAASIFADHSALGYVVIALLAFCLGVLATIFCFRLKKHREEKRDDA